MQYTLVVKSLKNVETLVSKLKEDGYQIYHNLENIYQIKDDISGLCIDLETKELFIIERSCLCSWSGGIKRPLYVEEIIDNYDRLIIQKDHVFYEQLLAVLSKDRSRPIGGIIDSKLY